MFYVIVEHALKGVGIVGPFPHEEDAQAWARSKMTFPHVWRIAQLTDPKDYVS